jgi:hypothetical protein
MIAEPLEDLIAYHREQARLSEELGRLAADLAVLAREVSDLKRSWPADGPHLVIVDERAVN